MSGQPPDRFTVRQVSDYIRANKGVYTDEAIEQRLLAKGFTPEAILAGKAALDSENLSDLDPTKDLRGRATGLLLGVFFLVWVVVALINSRSQFGSIGTFIFGGVLSVIALPTLIIMSASKGLKRGVQGALVTALVIPFLLLFVLAGMCVASISGSSL